MNIVVVSKNGSAPFTATAGGREYSGSSYRDVLGDVMNSTVRREGKCVVDGITLDGVKIQ